MNAVPKDTIHIDTPGSTGSPSPQRTSRRRKRHPAGSRCSLLICAVALAAAVLVTYVASCASATRHSYQRSRLQARLHRLQVERKLLEAQVADLQRMDRVLLEAKQLGMQPREALQYVALVPAKPAAREFRQASARP